MRVDPPTDSIGSLEEFEFDVQAFEDHGGV